ncbi:MAG: dienelactone hydrolase [Sphingomonadales bacterium 32-68-7]|nr:MAG: dienelactone hydrolase [Sphingomonadales bacterium 12-68-11]OYX10538.1 MAG: dienelactone hydrolase [Sphingomonadales bacterium 32-68-7]
MCELDQLNEMGSAVSKGAAVNRRQFAAIGAMATLAACTTVKAESVGGLTENMVSFPAPGGTMDAFFVHPASGKHPAVILWPDIAGLRDAKKVMGRRLAAEGFSVLVVNPFYRSAPAPQFKDFDDFRANGGFQKVGPWMQQNSHANVMETARALVAWLDRQAAVDTARGIGNQGYCMGGPFTVRTAAAVPGRVKAAASFHGGGLVNPQNAEDPTSPLKLIPQTQASYLIAISQDDDAQRPTDKDTLKTGAAAAGRPAEIEVYKGNHGWTVPDSPVYNQAEADRAWGRLLALYRSAL